MIKFIGPVIFAFALCVAPCFAAEKPSNTDKARATIEKDRQERVKKCSEAVKKVLDEHRCQIDVGMLVTPKGNIPQIQLIPLD